MKHKSFGHLKLFGVFLVSVLILMLVTPVQAALNKPEKDDKAISVTITTPDGVPGNVALEGKSTFYALKEPSGTETTIVLDLPFGSYHVNAKPVTFDGKYYIATTSQPQIPVGIGKAKDGNLKVQYMLADSAQDFHVMAIDDTSVSLTWTAPEEYKITVNRTEGSEPAANPEQGVPVEVAGNVAVDSGLETGTEYTYSLFSQYRGKWVGPIVVHVNTTETTEASETTYVVAPNTLLLGEEDVVSAEPTGDGVHLILGDSVEIPLIGSVIVLPVSESLPGGFIGIVTGVSADGREVDLVAGGLGDAFDYVNISVPDISDDPGSITVQSLATPKLSLSSVSVAESSYPPRPTGKSDTLSTLPFIATTQAISPLAVSPSSLLDSCADKLEGGASANISFDPSWERAGHFTLVIDKYNILGLDIPKGMILDTAIKITASGALSVDIDAFVSCNLWEKKLIHNIAFVGPVPISLVWSPKAEFSFAGEINIDNFGLTTTVGFETSGYVGIDGADFDTEPIFTIVPLVSSITTDGEFGLKLGGEIILGPGTGVTETGAIAGVSGEIDIVDVVIDPYGQACTEVTAGMSEKLGLTAEAWMGKLNFSGTWDLLEFNQAFPGTPWYTPSGCQSSEPEPDEDLLGPGVTPIDEGVVEGGSGQWTHTDSLSPGKAAWVLSTGNATDIIGSPDQLASTDLGAQGDNSLSALAGYPTYDAASYTVTIVPTGSKLHVKYVFASEEYPEYVGSIFNDVMAIFVDGVNCALVPGTNLPVSINTINHLTNSSYYINNSTGASGYNTAMDGLTVPLTCSVPVTPGVPVTIKIAVADASDHVLDSAVALLDGGIWSSD